MSVSLSAERDRIQRQVEELEQSLSATHAELDLLSSETGEESEDDESEQDEGGQSSAGLLAEREKIEREIQNLENVLGPHDPICVSDDDDSSSDGSELSLSPSSDSCLQMNLVYQQVVQETLEQLEALLTHNQRQQREVESQLSGPIKEPPREPHASSSCEQSHNMFLGRFLKPYFKDKLTGLGPPSNQETKEKACRMTGCLDNKKLKVKRWESWQKTLLIHSVARDTLRKLIQPKLSKVDYLSQKLTSAGEADKPQLRQQIDSLEKEIDMLKEKKEDELFGERFDDHDWPKISNVDFEGTRDAEDIQRFWQNFLHPSVNKTRWSQEEVQELKEVSERYQESHWETIAAELGTGRTAFLCLQTFQRFISGSLKNRGWTAAEDALLRELVEKMRIGNFIPYSQISYFIEGRDPAQLIYRWSHVLDPSLKRGPWTKEEDELLLRAVSYYGEKDWWKIRLEVPGRSDSGCRDRYLDCLKADTKRGPFDPLESEKLLQLVEKHGVGRWAKIAAEIPHRNDAQCLREWRKLSRHFVAQKHTRAKKPAGSSGRQKKKSPRVKKKIKRRLMKIKKESSEEEEEEEEEEMVIVYMDSDDDKKKVVKKEKVEVGVVEKDQEEVERQEEEVERQEEEVEKDQEEVEREEEEVEKDQEEVEWEEEEEEYTFPPMQQWIPAEKAQCSTFLSFRPVELSSSGDQNNEKVRLTIVGRFGRSVIIGPHPRELSWEKQHSSRTMMMVSADQLRIYMSHQANKYQPQSGKQNNNRVTMASLGYQLRAAVIPWIGNLLIPAKNKLSAADALREQGERRQLSSTPIFLLFLQTMNVDTMGCKEAIEQRRNRVIEPTPTLARCSAKTKGPKTVARALQEKRQDKEELDLQHKLILEQLQAVQQQQQQQLLLKQQQQTPQVLVLQQHPAPTHPGILLQIPPNMHPQMSPMSFPQAVFIPHPVTQPHPASIQFMPHSSLTIQPLASSRSPAPQRMIVPPLSAVTTPSNATFTCSASGPLRTSPNPTASIESNPSLPVPGPSQSCPTPSPSSSTLTPPKTRELKKAEVQEAVVGSPNGVDMKGKGNDVSEACTGVNGADGSMIKDNRRIRTPSQKAKALQEATEAKAEAKKKAASSPRKPAHTKHTKCPPQGVSTAPVQLVPQTLHLSPPAGVICSPLLKTEAPPAPSPKLEVPCVSVNLSKMVPPTCSEGSVSSTQNICLAPPPSIQTNQNAVSSTALFLSDHDYSLFNLGPTLSQRKPNPAPKQRKHKICKSDSAPKKTIKAPPKKRKRVSSEEKQSVTSSQDSRVVDGTGDTVSVKSDAVTVTGDAVSGTDDAVATKDDAVTGLIQEGKRVRKPSQRARALQETSQAKAEAKKKRTSPPKKRSRTSRSKLEVVKQKEQVTLVPGMCLNPGQSIWVMTPSGMVQLAEAPPQGLQLALAPCAPLPAPHRKTLKSQPSTPPSRPIAPHPTTAAILPHPSPALPTCPPKPLPPAFILQPVPNPGSSSLPMCPPKPPSTHFLPFRSTITTDKAASTPLRNETLQFDPSLMFLESRVEVQDWLSGQGGVVVRGAGVALPYLPPFVSSLSTLSALLRVKKSLTKLSMQLLCRPSEPRPPQTKSKPDSSTERTSSPPPDLPDSTSDLTPAAEKPAAPSVSAESQEVDEEEERVAALRQLVAERFSDNPAYQMLKARFLSCFTVPALLATVQPITEKPVPPPANEEKEKDGEEEEEGLQRIKERGKQRKAERSLLPRDGSGASAHHFSGITKTPTSNQTGLDQTVQ